MARVLVTARGGAGVLRQLEAPEGVVLDRCELPLPEELASSLAGRLVAQRRTDAAVLVHRDPTLFTVGVVATTTGLVDPADLVDELGWFGIDATLVAPLDGLQRAVARAGVRDVVGLVVPADDDLLAGRAAQLVVDAVADALPTAPQRRRRPFPPVHGRRCRQTVPLR